MTHARPWLFRKKQIGLINTYSAGFTFVGAVLID